MVNAKRKIAPINRESKQLLALYKQKRPLIEVFFAKLDLKRRFKRFLTTFR